MERLRGTLVLDENALEAMLARQRDAERSHKPQTSIRTEKTEEFEVYEREAQHDVPSPAAPRTPDPAVHPAPDAASRPAPSTSPPAAPLGASTQEELFEELPGRGTPPQADSAAPAPRAAEPPARPGAVERDGEARRPRRPQVWPPIQRAQATPEDAPAGPAAEGPAADAFAPAATASHAPTPSAHPGTAAHPATPPAQRPSDAAPQPPSQPSNQAPAPTTHAPDPHGPAQRPDGHGCSLAVVQAVFNAEITDAMAAKALETARATGAEVRHHVQVPGVYDLPLAVHTLARRKDVDAVVVIGCVIQGETDHDDLITFTTAKTLQEVALETQTPIGLGIIGPGMTWEQAQARIGNGAHAVTAAVAQWRLMQTV